VARFLLGWSVPSSWLAGVALSTTSVAVVYAVMLELGLNRTDFGKGILAAAGQPAAIPCGPVYQVFPAAHRYRHEFRTLIMAQIRGARTRACSVHTRVNALRPHGRLDTRKTAQASFQLA
jgi:hypothetical protein